MQDKNQQTSKNAEYFKGKGLGWVPDYPDLRDYNLDDEDIKNSQRLKVDQTTASIENLIFELIKSNSKENISKSQIDELRNKIFGEVVFKKARVYKILRYNQEQKKQESRKTEPNKVKFDSLRSKQILQLKKYLFFLLVWLGMKEEGNQNNKVDRDLKNFVDNVNKTVNWMNNGEEYDEDMKKIVEDFQRSTEIRLDSIVGLDTYTELKKFFKTDKFNPDKTQLSIEKKDLHGDSCKETFKPSKNIKYFSLFSSVPDVFFEEIVKTLLLESKNNNSDEKSSLTNRLNNIFKDIYFKYSTIPDDDIINEIKNIIPD
ncbi:MAG: hypothetical protein AAFX46_14730, partial [Cyanobacteria bacterium J06636_27]